MRYFIKAYPMHEPEVDALAEEAATGAVDADIGHGLVTGTADEAAIARLAAKGIVVQALGPVPDDGPVNAEEHDENVDERSPAGTILGGIANRLNAIVEGLGVGAAKLGQVPRYWLADLLTGLTDDAIGKVEAAGAKIVERDPTGSFVLRIDGDDAALRGLPFVRNLRVYGVVETLSASSSGVAAESPDVPPLAAGIPGDAEGSDDGSGAAAATAGVDFSDLDGIVVEANASPPPLSSSRFEAICHEPSDLQQVADAIGALGGSVVASTGRAVRFVLNPTDIESVAAIPGVASVAAARSPELRSDFARLLIGLGQAGPPNSLLPFEGKGEKIGVADTGIDKDHPDFASKTVTIVALGRPNDASDPDGHGTHVAGTIAGDGTASRAQGVPANQPAPLRGVAPAADLYFQSVMDINGGLGGLPDSMTDLLQPAYDAGVRIHNNSWGAYIQSRYDSMALDFDEFVHNNPDFLPVIAAGNEGSCRPGSSAKVGFVDYPSLGSPGIAKNAITVGASRSNRTSGGLSALTWQEAWPDDFSSGPIGSEGVSGDPEGLAAFSSRGPVDEFRLKPDLVAPGTDIAATRSSKAPLSHFWGAYPNNRFYAFMGGTSMACPLVTGCAALVREYYRTQQQVAEPSAALLKATLINGTRRLTGDDAVAPPDGRPNYHQGFGRIDLARSIPDPAAPAFDLFFVDTWKREPAFRFVNRKGRLRWEINVQKACELRIALVWTDYPGRSVQNQLRVILDTRKAGTTVNWIGNQDAPTFIKFTAHDPTVLLPGQDNVLTRDPQNNVQIIRAAVEPGSHMLALFADGLLKLPQDFALVATYPVGAITVTVS